MRFDELLDYRPAPAALAGRRILVTGAGSGIGAAVARALASHGATVVLLGRRVAPLETVYDAIAAAGGAAAIYPLDLLSAGYVDFERLRETLARELGGLDGVLSNAAMLGELAPLARYEPQLWAAVHQVNLHAPFMMLQNLLPLLWEAPEAAVLVTLDAKARAASAYWGAYATSKAALERLLILLAEESAPQAGLRVHGLCPPPADTALRRRAYPAESRAGLAAPEALTGPFLFLLGPDGAGCPARILG